MCSESYSANVDIIKRLHDILHFFNNCLKNILIQNGRKYKDFFNFFTTSYTEWDVAPLIFVI